MTPGTTKRMLIMLAVAGAIVGGVVWFQHFKNTMTAKAIKGMANPPQTVPGSTRWGSAACAPCRPRSSSVAFNDSNA
jgi:membrane fusion protein (multidrug efflux system)